MNERIKELMVQSIDYACVNQKSMDTAMEKFAELIVKECVKQCEDIAFKHLVIPTTYSSGMKTGAFECAAELRQYFGVDNK